MVKAKRKPLDEIINFVEPYNHILTVGCGGCVSVCLAGGQREVSDLNIELSSKIKKANDRKTFDAYTVERQCNEQFLQELEELVDQVDCILSMACGAGVQNMAAYFPKTPVFPAVNTVSIGIDKDLGMYEEKCRACGHCVLGYTGGICPVTRCSKGLFNGPCGGTNNGKCEVSQEIPCAWNDIYHQLKEQNRLEDILKVHPPMQWQNQIPRTTIQEPYKDRYMSEK